MPKRKKNFQDPPKMVRRVVLIGFRGAGKSTLGQELARRLSWRYFSTDRLIEAEAGMSIAEMVSRHGWTVFRDRETRVTEQLQTAREAVIDCGGGIVENERNMQFLLPDSFVVWVDAALPLLLQRIGSDPGRPLLSEKNPRTDLEKNYRRRLPLYRKYSHFYVDTTRATVQEVCETILERLKNHER